MKHSRNNDLLSNARALRKNMTPQERKLWYQFLRFCAPRFRRQEIIGNYIADFYCHTAKLVIEIDGSQHYYPEEREKDNSRIETLRKEGLKSLRFSNTEINTNFTGVCHAILLALEQCGITPQIHRK